MRAAYAPAIGAARAELTTPALLLDLDVLRANLGFMAEHMQGAPATLRAHVKVHKSPHIARLEVEAGAIGVGCATVWEAIVMARAGIPDVFVINEVVGAEKVRALALLAREAQVKVAVDDAAQVDVLSAAAVAAGSTIGVPDRRGRGHASLRRRVGGGGASRSPAGSPPRPASTSWG